MDRAAAQLRPVFQHGLVDAVAVKSVAAKRRHQRRMDVHHAVGEIRRDRDPLKKPAHHDQIGPRAAAVVEDRPAEVVLRRQSSCARLRRWGCRPRGRIAGRGRPGCWRRPKRFPRAILPRRIFSMKLRSVVPPPEIKTAMRKGREDVASQLSVTQRLQFRHPCIKMWTKTPHGFKPYLFGDSRSRYGFCAAVIGEKFHNALGRGRRFAVID